MSKFYVEVTESKKWIFEEITADDVEEASTIAMGDADGTEDELTKYVNHARTLD